MISWTRCRLEPLALALLLASSGALGAAAVPAAVKEKLKLAQMQYDLSHFEDSLQLFSEAYELKPLPGVLFNIAQCHRHLAHWERAAFFYRRYLALSPTRPRNAAEVNELLTEVEKEGASEQQRKEAAERDEREKRELELARLSTQREAALDPAPPPALAPAPAPAAFTPPVAAGELQTSGGDPVFKRWWFWTGVGVVAAGAAATAYVLTAPQARNGTLPTINAR